MKLSYLILKTVIIVVTWCQYDQFDINLPVTSAWESIESRISLTSKEVYGIFLVM